MFHYNALYTRCYHCKRGYAELKKQFNNRLSRGFPVGGYFVRIASRTFRVKARAIQDGARIAEDGPNSRGPNQCAVYNAAPHMVQLESISGVESRESNVIYQPIEAIQSDFIPCCFLSLGKAVVHMGVRWVIIIHTTPQQEEHHGKAANQWYYQWHLLKTFSFCYIS